jgi:acylphosphatase
MNLTAKHILVKGKVQGVFFRKETRLAAEKFGITGWVRNTGDGNVEIFAQSNEDAIKQFIDWCRQGPPKADVKDVEVRNADTNNNIKHFSIKY